MKREGVFVVALMLLASVSAWSAGAEGELELTLPPDSIAQWYKPNSKRQVWLHTMFRLRRSMQAIQEYTALRDEERLDKWGSRFIEDYRSITTMVPEWSDEVEPRWINRLEAVIKNREWEKMGKALGKVGMTCRSCHDDFRAVTAALYRAPNFGNITVEDSETLEELPFSEAMNNLSRSMNRFKIAVEDQRMEAASEYLESFSTRVMDLGGSCEGCHRDEIPHQRILGSATEALLEELATLVETEPAGVGRKLGEVGVAVCARCHGVHRTLSDLSGVLRP